MAHKYYCNIFLLKDYLSDLPNIFVLKCYGFFYADFYSLIKANLRYNILASKICLHNYYLGGLAI